MTREQQPFGLRLRGHANYEEAGKDIVCAGASALAITTVNSLEILCEIPLALHQEDGFLEARCTQPPTKEAQLLLRSFGLGMRQIQQVYGAEYLSYQEITQEVPFHVDDESSALRS